MANEDKRGDAYTVLTPANCAIGPGALVINNIGTLPLEWKRPLELPRQYLEKVVMRAEELAQVHTRLQGGTGTAITGKGASEAMWGAPGVGKSTLAALYAERYQEQYPGGILWLSMGPETRGTESANPALKRMAAYAYRADAQALAHLAGVVFSPEVVRSLLEGHGPLLIVVDDVWDSAVLAPLHKALPTQGYLLVTTREARVARLLGQTVELDVLTREDALTYTSHPLFMGTDKQPRKLSQEQQEGLIKAVGRHPLALAIALGDLCIRSEDSWSDCIEKIEQMVAQGKGFGDLPLLDEADRESRVGATLRHSYEAMGQEYQRRFRALGCMAQEASFDTAAAAAIWGDDKWNAQNYLDVFAARALLKRRQSGRWQQHSILRAYALSLQSADEKQALPPMHAYHYLSIVQACYKIRPRDYDRLEREFTQVAHAFSLAIKDNQSWAIPLAGLCTDFLLNRGRLFLLRTWLQGAQHLSATHGGALGKANTLQSMGDLESRLGNVEAARRYYDDALPLFEAKQSPLGRANTLRSLGDLERRLGNLEVARRHYDAALPLYETAESRLGKANTLQSLGDLERRLGNVEAARRYYDAALPLCEAEKDQLGKANTLKSMGDLERHLGNVAAARRHYDAALPLYEAEQSRLGKANTLQSLGDLESRLGNMGAARRHYDAALPLYEAEQGRLGKANTLQSLGDVERRLGHLEAARRNYDAALPLFEAEQSRLGKANTLQSLGDLEKRLGNVEAARRNYDAAIPLYEAEKDRLGKANTLKSMGDLESRLGNVEAARRHYNTALSLCEAEKDRLGKANTLRSLGDLELHLGNMEAARRHYDAALPFYEAEQSRLGKANTHRSIGDLERRLGNVEAARRHYDAALPLFEAEQSRLGKANTLQSLGDLESRLGNVEAARMHYNAALLLFEEDQSRLGKANILKGLGDLESRLGNVEAARRDYDAALPLYEAEQSRLGKANTLQSLGDLESRLGNVEAARRRYDAALPLYEAEQNPNGLLNVNISLARIERSMNNIRNASAFYEAVLKQAQNLPAFADHPLTQSIRKEYEELLRKVQQGEGE